MKFQFAFIVNITITIALAVIYLIISDSVNFFELFFFVIFGSLFFFMFFLEGYSAQKRNKITSSIKIFIAKIIFFICFCSVVIAIIRDIYNINDKILYLILLKGNEELIIINLLRKANKKHSLQSKNRRKFAQERKTTNGTS
jgi:hypothetical protein